MLGSVGSARSFARAQLVYRLGTRDSGLATRDSRLGTRDSGLATRDLALLCLELRSAYLDRRLARLISANLIRLAVIFFIKETIHRRKKSETKTDRIANS